MTLTIIYLHYQAEMAARYTRLKADLLMSSHGLTSSCFFFFFNDPAPPEIYPLSLHDALPISVRLAGVGALWWFAACAAPVVAALTTCAFLRPPTNAPSSRSNTTVATWASPVVLVTLAARVCAGTPDSPALVLVALVAPLLALLARSADPMPPTNGVVVLATTAAVGLVLWANLSVVADVARPMGVPRHTALVALAATAFLGMTWRAARRPVADTA